MYEAKNPVPFPLFMADEERSVRIVAVRAGRGLHQRLTEMGLNIGGEVRVVRRQAAGLIVARGETRLAIGSGMASKIIVVPADVDGGCSRIRVSDDRGSAE